MENASKALIMAAGVLIGLMIISLAVFLFMNFGSTSSNIHEQIQQEQIEQFNTQFTSYQGKDSLTIYDVITVANLAKDNNTYYGLSYSDRDDENSYYISVHLKTKTNGERKHLENQDKAKLEEYITNDLENITDSTETLKHYKCKTITFGKTTGLVNEIKFEEI